MMRDPIIEDNDWLRDQASASLQERYVALQTENTELRERQQSALKVLRNSHLTIGRKSAWVRGILEGWSDDEETE